MKKILWIVLLLPLALILVSLAVANRHNVVLVLDPFSPTDPALSVQLPFFAYLLGAVLFGFILGGLVSWIDQGKQRKSAKKTAKEAKEWRQRAEKLSGQLENRNVGSQLTKI